MYKFTEPDVNQLEMFEKSLPFGGQMNRDNRWIRLADIVPWGDLESSYAKTFSTTGRPGIRARYVLGSIIIKHQLQCSDDELGEQISENPYMQYFIGLERYQYHLPFDISTLSNVRKRVGKEQFDEFEQQLIDTLVKKKLIRPKGMLTDATVFQSEITFPTDCGLLNKARQFCVKHIKRLGKVTGRKVRTYCRVAQKTYVAFSKKRRKTHKDVRQMQKNMLQYVRRNIRQLSELITEVKEQGQSFSKPFIRNFKTVQEIYRQQKQMYESRTKSIGDRIVSLHKPYIRPIKTGKERKNTEFGAKVSLTHVNGYMFADHVSFDNYNEGTKLRGSIERFQQRFTQKPDYVSADQSYGSKENRDALDENGIRFAVKPLGRIKKETLTESEKRWRRKKHVERNHIEGAIGNSKSKYSLGLVRAKTDKTEYSWIRFALMSRNIALAGARIR
jgi:hypothetical protein